MHRDRNRHGDGERNSEDSTDPTVASLLIGKRFMDFYG